MGTGGDGVVAGKRCKACFVGSAWQNVHNSTRVGDEGHFALTTKSFLACSDGGIISVKSSGQDRVADEEEPVKEKGYLERSLEQLVFGNYTEEVTALGTVGQIGLGLTGLDLPADIRDLSHDLKNWEWSWSHAGKTFLDGIGFIPFIGSLKTVDEVATLVKGVDKTSDVLKNTDETAALMKNTDELGSARKADDVIYGASAVGGKEFVDNPFIEGSKTKLKANIRYKAGEKKYDYETDSLGRLCLFFTDNLQLTKRTTRLRHNRNSPGKLAGDHAGHLAADRFGGSKNLDNIVSQLPKVNLSSYRKLENEWAAAIKEGKTVTVRVDIKYNGIGTRPTKFIVEYIIDGIRSTKDILN